MRYYPAYLDIRDRRCLVVGGGRVGTRKVKTLLKCGAKITVISLKATVDLSKLAEKGLINLELRDYCSNDLNQVFLVIGATDDQDLNHKIYQDAEECGRLCNIADQPHLCNFVLPSIINQGDLTIAISTAGKSPAFAKHLRCELQGRFGPEYGQLLDLMGEIRNRLLAKEHAPEAHKPLFERLIQSGLLDMLKDQNYKKINMLLEDVLGSSYKFEELMKKR